MNAEDMTEMGPIDYLLIEWPDQRRMAKRLR